MRKLDIRQNRMEKAEKRGLEMLDMHITLLSAGLAGFINIWLAVRCGRTRMKSKVLHGDGGNVALQRRMRAHANFTEYTPVTLILIAALELTGHGGWLLAVPAAVFLIGRVLHAIGLDADEAGTPRFLGMLCTLPIILVLGIAAVLAAFRVI